MTSSEKLPAGTLCCICEDEATGRHYGVPSCSGCKTFYRRCIVNNRNFKCLGNGNCPVNKDVRCTCRYCRFHKCLQMGMDRNAIQSSRDRIGYTKRTRKSKKNVVTEISQGINGSPNLRDESGNNWAPAFSDDDDEAVAKLPGTSQSVFSDYENGTDPLLCTSKANMSCPGDPVLERLTLLENNFSLLLSRGKIETYGSLDEALAAPSIFAHPINVKLTDSIAAPEAGKNQRKMPFWRSRIITLYVDWAKTFGAFRKLPYADKIALITNHASSYLITCEAFRTPEKITEEFVQSTHYFGGISPSSGILYNSPVHSNNPDYESSFVQNSVEKTKAEEERDLHNIFDPNLITSSSSCKVTGVRSLVDIPPDVHPTIGSLSGLAPVMSTMIDYVMKPFRRLSITTTEFATLQAIMFFDSDTEGLDAASQRNVAAEQKKFIAALYAHIRKNHDQVATSERFASLLLRIPTIRKIASKKNECLQIIDMFNLFSLNSLVRETALGIRPNANHHNQTNKCGT
ncbi:Zinc finger, C4 type [Aphelenchoides besseyi]|nr:Zinc finger, C4 type [Aphelenchoides besseyi]KAI6199721.1 Zinc finger, C4 type [Aphelenchoides besseyi]